MDSIREHRRRAGELSINSEVNTKRQRHRGGEFQKNSVKHPNLDSAAAEKSRHRFHLKVQARAGQECLQQLLLRVRIKTRKGSCRKKEKQVKISFCQRTYYLYNFIPQPNFLLLTKSLFKDLYESFI